MIGAFAILSQKKREKELLIPDIVKGLLWVVENILS